jgi:multiple sugar transport system substrate-binding protein
MKKTLAILLVLTLVIGSFAACGGGEPAETEGPVKLVIAARGGSHVDVINAVKAQFEADNNCTIEVLGLEAADLKQKVSLDAKNEKGTYDLMMIDDPWMPEYAQAGMMMNLTEAGYVDDEDFVEASLMIGKDPYGTGDTYALPFAGNVTLLFYNQGVLDAAGATVPDNWADVLKISKAVNGKDGKIGYVIRGQQGNPIVGDFMPILWAYGGDIFDKDWNVVVNSPEAVAALNLYKELLANGVNYEKNDIVSSVADGKAAMSLGWPSWFISPEGSSLAGYARIPGKVDAAATDNASGVIGNWMMAVTANSQNPELAMQLLEYLTSADTQKAAADSGAVPTRISVFTDSELSAKYPFYATLLDATEKSRVRPRTPLWSEIENVFGIELSNAISNTKSVEQALADSQTAIEGIMK